MSEPFIGEIRPWACTFAPRDWALCEGQTLQIVQNQALYAIIGIAFGGDGRTTFCLPDLRGKAPMHPGNGPGLTPRRIGEGVGTSAVTLAAEQLPLHTHGLVAQNVDGGTPTPAGNFPAKGVTPSGRATAPWPTYAAAAPAVAMAPSAIQAAGGGQPHNNQQPLMAVNLCIALRGIFPSRG